MSRDILDLPPPPADARLPYGPDPFQFGDLRLPTGDGPHPVVVVIHGGFWRARYGLEHAGHLCAALTARGLATWSLEYRRVGNPGGGWPGTFRDVTRGLDHVRELAAAYSLDPERTVALGHSAGGHLALWLAGRHRVPAGDPLHGEASTQSGASDAVGDVAGAASGPPTRLRGAVSLAVVVDLRRAWELRLSDTVVETFIGGPPTRVPERYAAASPIELLPLGVPHALVHGTADENVPYEISRTYHAAAVARGDPATLVTLLDAGHFEVIDPRSKEWPHVVDVTLRLLDAGG